METTHDVAIIGGGPAGSTTGTLLRKYDPSLRVIIVEKETFPREHVGESQLPGIGSILQEMGVWEKVEAAEFPIKVGATYRWGASKDLWDFEFVPISQFEKQATQRPAKFEGVRALTAFQVERAKYDEILLDHAEDVGCEVRQGVRVDSVLRENDRVTGLSLSDETTVTARHYIDASGHIGTIRKAMGVECEYPTRLKNMATWDYWENAEWATEIGVGGTRVQVLSIGSGWIWFIPLGPTRTSIGFICPVDHYKNCGMTPEELYLDAISKEPRVTELTRNATRDGEIRTTKDWSFVAERLVGENWMLVGESGGFADPILAGGMLLTHTGAREAAYSILDLDAGRNDPSWIKKSYNETQRLRMSQYIRFADFWYCANGQFTDLEALTQEIARDAGLEMSPKQAFRWLSLGGFLHEDFSLPGLGGLDLLAVREVTRIFVGEEKVDWELNKYNVLKLNLLGAKKQDIPIFEDGIIKRASAYFRGGKVLPVNGVFEIILDVLADHADVPGIYAAIEARSKKAGGYLGGHNFVGHAMSTIEAMLLDGWVVGKVDASKPRGRYEISTAGQEANFHWNRDEVAGGQRGELTAEQLRLLDQ